MKNEITWKSRKKMSKLLGTLRKKGKKGTYYYRVQIATGERREFSLKTSDPDEALQQAAAMDAVIDAPNKEVALAQINAMKGYSKKALNLPLSEIWAKYEVHPDRARPLTPHESLMYRSTLQEFIEYAYGITGNPKNKRTALSSICEVTSEFVSGFVDYLKTTKIAVDTHNRKLRRLRKIFDCLKDYYDGENPFRKKAFFRNEREEQGSVVRRLAFTQDQEQQLRDVLIDDTYKVMHKPEIRVIYYLGMFTGQRLKDCVLLQWQNVDMKRKRISVKQFKTGKEVMIPMADSLFQVLKDALKWKINQYVCPNVAARYNKTDVHGKNVGNNHVNLDVLRVIRWIGLEPSVAVPGRNKKMTVYGFHSLRHSFCSFCAEAGIPKAVLLSILGTDGDIADKYYTHVGEQAQREAIEAISQSGKSKSAQEKINLVLDLLENDPEPTHELLQQIKEILS